MTLWHDMHHTLYSSECKLHHGILRHHLFFFFRTNAQHANATSLVGFTHVHPKSDLTVILPSTSDSTRFLGNQQTTTIWVICHMVLVSACTPFNLLVLPNKQ